MAPEEKDDKGFDVVTPQPAMKAPKDHTPETDYVDGKLRGDKSGTALRGPRSKH